MPVIIHSGGGNIRRPTVSSSGGGASDWFEIMGLSDDKRERGRKEERERRMSR